MYFTGIKVTNLLYMIVIKLHEFMYSGLGTEIEIIRKCRLNQLITWREDARNFLLDVFYDDVSMICKNKDHRKQFLLKKKRPLGYNE